MGSSCQGNPYRLEKAGGIWPVHQVQNHSGRVTFLQPARRAAVLDQPSSLRPHCVQLRLWLSKRNNCRGNLPCVVQSKGLDFLSKVKRFKVGSAPCLFLSHTRRVTQRGKTTPSYFHALALRYCSMLVDSVMYRSSILKFLRRPGNRFRQPS
jgi:hypothetical protein